MPEVLSHFADLERIEERMDELNVLIEACKRKVPDSN
jgi:tetrahydromethanopterin S-methyltransferase subunit G